MSGGVVPSPFREVTVVSRRPPLRLLVTILAALILVAVAGYVVGWSASTRPVSPAKPASVTCLASESAWFNTTAVVTGDRVYGCLFLNADVTFMGNVTVTKLLWVGDGAKTLTFYGSFTNRGAAVSGVMP